ncbi:hypothetical protein VrSk94_14680 [Vibrio rotiferianus]
MLEKQVTDIIKTTRQPNRLVSIPATGIANNAPTPRHRSNKPRVPSLTIVLAFTLGMIAAHAAVVKPEAKNIALVALTSTDSNKSICNKDIDIIFLYS